MSPLSKLTKGIKYQKNTLEELEANFDVLAPSVQNELAQELKLLNGKAKTFVGIGVLESFRHWSQIADWKRSTKKLSARAAISSTTARADAILIRNSRRSEAPSANTSTAIDLAGREPRDPFADAARLEASQVTEVVTGTASPFEVLGIQRTVRFSNEIATSSSVEQIGLRPVKTRKTSGIYQES